MKFWHFYNNSQKTKKSEWNFKKIRIGTQKQAKTRVCLIPSLDSKSCGLSPCQFESDYPYQIEKPCIFLCMVFIFAFFYSDFLSKICPRRFKSLANRVRMGKKNNIKTNAILSAAFVQKISIFDTAF